MEDKKKIENMQAVKKAIENLSPELLKEDVIRDNKNEFIVDSKLYRVTLPTNKQRSEAERYKQRTYMELLQTEGYYTRSQLIKILKEHKDVDIEELDEKIKVISDQIEGLYDKISETHTDNIKSLESLIPKVKDRLEKIQKLSIEKAELLAFCIEEEVYTRHLEYLVVVCVQENIEPDETGKESTWKRVWNSQEEFDNDDNMVLAETATLKFSQLFASMRGF